MIFVVLVIAGIGCCYPLSNKHIFESIKTYTYLNRARCSGHVDVSVNVTPAGEVLRGVGEQSKLNLFSAQKELQKYRSWNC